MRRLIALLVLAGAIAAAVVLTAAGPKTGPIATYKIEFDNVFGLTEGGDITVAGVKAGKTPGPFELTDEERPKALVTAEIEKPGFTPFRADAHCDVRQQSLIGTYYVSCQPGKSPRKLPNGATIPVEQTTSTIPLDLVNNIMRRPYKERFRILLMELGTGLAGRPQDIAEVLQRAHPGLRETSRTLKVLGDQNQIIKRFIRDSDTVVEELEANKNDVARFVKESGETAEIAATRQNDIRRGFQLLPGFLRELRPTMARLGQLSDAQVPLLIDLRQAAPELRKFLVESEPFARASRPALRSLGRTSVTGIRAIEESDEEIRQLRRLAEPLPRRGSSPAKQGVTRPLRQLLVSLDDRRRSIEDDKRARDTAPPRPDPVAYRNGQGFTAMEGFWNYAYWQALGINIFDDTGHFLRVLGVTDDHCGEYTANPTSEQRRDQCAAFMGNHQPCIRGYRQPSGFNRPEICGGRFHGDQEPPNLEGDVNAIEFLLGQ
jgi:ABC-type transporter Mla subunit MlaD